MDDFALTSAERALFLAFNQRGVRFLIVGLGAAVMEGAPVSTQDLDVWLEHPGDERVRLAAQDAGGFWIAGFGLYPPGLGGVGLERIDTVLTTHGLQDFDVEFTGSHECTVDGVTLRVLPLERVIASKRAANRPKDLAALPALEASLLARDHRG